MLGQSTMFWDDFVEMWQSEVKYVHCTYSLKIPASQQRACTSISKLDSSSFQRQFQYKKSYTMGENAPISRVKVKAFALRPPGGATVRRAAGHRAPPFRPRGAAAAPPAAFLSSPIQD